MSKLGIKLLLSGMSNCGKTNALKTLDPAESFVVSVDGKLFPFAVPHSNFGGFTSINAFINGEDIGGEHTDGIIDKINKFKEKTGSYPRNVVIDTVSRVFQIIADNAGRAFKGFDVHSNISKEIAEFNRFIEQDLVGNGMNVISTTHVTLNTETSVYEDASSGAYKKSGGAISVHDNVSFFFIKNKKYHVTHKAAGLPCRSLLSDEELPATQLADDYSLNDHIALLENKHGEALTFVL